MSGALGDFIPTTWYPESTCKISPVVPEPRLDKRNNAAPPTSFKFIFLSMENYIHSI